MQTMASYERNQKGWLPEVDNGCYCCKLETCCKVQGYFVAVSIAQGRLHDILRNIAIIDESLIFSVAGHQHDVRADAVGGVLDARHPEL